MRFCGCRHDVAIRRARPAGGMTERLWTALREDGKPVILAARSAFAAYLGARIPRASRIQRLRDRRVRYRRLRSPEKDRAHFGEQVPREDFLAPCFHFDRSRHRLDPSADGRGAIAGAIAARHDAHHAVRQLPRGPRGEYRAGCRRRLALLPGGAAHRSEESGAPRARFLLRARRRRHRRGGAARRSPDPARSQQPQRPPRARREGAQGQELQGSPFAVRPGCQGTGDRSHGDAARRLERLRRQ